MKLDPTRSSKSPAKGG